MLHCFNFRRNRTLFDSFVPCGGAVCIAILFLFFLSQQPAHAQSGGAKVCGAITSSTTWTLASSPYTVTCDLTINAGVTVTVQAGVVVKIGYNFGFDSKIFVKGHLLTQGSAANPVIFTSLADNVAGEWDGITFNGGSGHLSHTIVRYAGWSDTAITVDTIASGGELLIENSQIVNNDYDAMWINPSELHQVRLLNNRFANNGWNGVYLYGNTSTVIGNAELVAQTGLAGYALNGDLTIDSGVTLTVGPGIKIWSHPTEGIIVKGHLEATGTITNPVIFTSVQDTGAGQWRGIEFTNGTGHLQHTIVRYAGWAGYNAVEVTTVPLNGEVRIEDSQLVNNDASPLNINVSELHQVRLVNNLFQDNRSNMINLSGNTLANNSTLALNPGLQGYYHYGDLTINSSVRLTVAAGVKLVFGDPFATLLVNGHLEAQGTAVNPVVFTSNEDNGAGQWGGIEFANGTGHLDHVIVRYAGANGLGYGVNISGVPTDGEVMVENSQFRNHSRQPLKISPSELHQVHLLNNSYIDNGVNAIQVNGGTNAIVGNVTLSPQAGLMGYQIGGNLTLNAGVMLTLDAGTVIQGGNGGQMVIKGDLEASGTITNPVIFTSQQDFAAGQWNGVRFEGGTGNLNYVIVRYAGYSFGVPAIDVASIRSGGVLRIRNSQLLSSAYNGLSITQGKVTLNCVTIRENAGNGVVFTGVGTPAFTIANSTIADNTTRGLLNQKTTQIDARNTWWGDVSGPGGNGTGLGNSVSGNVLFDPWLTAPPTDCPATEVDPTPTPNATATATNTPTNTPTNTSINTPSSTPTATNMPLPTATATPFATMPPPPTPTTTSTATSLPSSTLTATSIATNTPLPTSTATSTPTLRPGLSLAGIMPNEGTVGQTTNVVITGGGLNTVTLVQFQNAGSAYTLENLSAATANQLLATIPANLPAGLYDLLVHTAGGESAVLPNVFSLIANTPQIIEVRPNHGVSDLPNEISIHGFNFAPGVNASLNETALTVTRINGNELFAVVPSDMAAGKYNVIVTNPGNQKVELANGYTVYDSSSNNDLFGYTYELWTKPSAPRVGETAQIGFFVHRQGGKDVLQNVKVRFLLGDATGSTLGEAEIPFLDQINRFESTPPINVTFSQPGEVVLTAIIDPESSVAEDNESNNVITRTLTVAPPGADGTAPLINNVRINNGAAQTTVANVDVEIEATDPTPNPSGMRSVYLVEYIFNTAVNQWVPIQQSGWLPYDATPDNYTWNLRPSAGMHYLQVRALDNATNISVGAARAPISYLPPSDTIGRGQTRIYRFNANAGQQLDVQVEVISGDADLYVWSSNPAQSARVSNNQSGNEHVHISVNEITPGIYQIEVYGFAATEYRLTVEIGEPSLDAAAVIEQAVQQNDKIPPTAPAIPVANTPDDRQGVPPAPPTNRTTSEQHVFLPLVNR